MALQDVGCAVVEVGHPHHCVALVISKRRMSVYSALSARRRLTEAYEKECTMTILIWTLAGRYFHSRILTVKETLRTNHACTCASQVNVYSVRERMGGLADM